MPRQAPIAARRFVKIQAANQAKIWPQFSPQQLQKLRAQPDSLCLWKKLNQIPGSVEHAILPPEGRGFVGRSLKRLPERTYQGPAFFGGKNVRKERKAAFGNCGAQRIKVKQESAASGERF